MNIFGTLDDRAHVVMVDELQPVIGQPVSKRR
jgi:hypothetical protein